MDPSATPTLYARFTRNGARWTFALLAALCLLGLPTAGVQSPTRAKATGPGDMDLYRAVIADMRRGETYAQAAVHEQRARRYPVRPFYVVRPPALGTALAVAPSAFFPILAVRLLALAVVIAWVLRLRQVLPGPRLMAWTALLLLTAVVFALAGEPPTLLHEVWAGLLIALSLALRTDRRFAASVLAALLAALIRELAMPYLLVMAAFAVSERRWREAGAFVAAVLIVAGTLAIHAHAVEALTTSRDPASQGWLAFGGWRFALQATDWNGLGVALGPWSPALLLPAALIGAYAWEDRRLITVLAGYLAGLMVFGRPDNFYWGLIIAPLLGVGLALAPVAFRDLWVTARLPIWRRRAA